MRLAGPLAGYFAARSTGLPAFVQPRIPSGITATFAYPSCAASRAAMWLAVQLGLVQ
jgi:hypothetical protein